MASVAAGVLADGASRGLTPRSAPCARPRAADRLRVLSTHGLGRAARFAGGSADKPPFCPHVRARSGRCRPPRHASWGPRTCRSPSQDLLRRTCLAISTARELRAIRTCSTKPKKKLYRQPPPSAASLPAPHPRCASSPASPEARSVRPRFGGAVSRASRHGAPAISRPATLRLACTQSDSFLPRSRARLRASSQTFWSWAAPCSSAPPRRPGARPS